MKVKQSTLRRLIVEEFQKMMEQDFFPQVTGGMTKDIPCPPGQVQVGTKTNGAPLCGPPTQTMEKRCKKGYVLDRASGSCILDLEAGPETKKKSRRTKTKSGRRIRKAGTLGYKKMQYPHDKFPRYSVPGDDKASFKKFYAAVRKNREARQQLGKRDYHWGQKHSDAYATLNQGTRGNALNMF